MQPWTAQYKDLFVAAVAEADPAGTMPVMLSGGIDSATILAAQLELGRHPDCYTFQCGRLVSRDVVVAADQCKAYDCRHVIVEMPRTPEVLVADIIRLHALGVRPIKTHVQCSQPFLYVSPAAVADGHKRAFYGMWGDTLFGSGRYIESYWKTEGEDWARQVRRESMDDVDGSDGPIRLISAHAGLDLYSPFRHPAIIEFLLARNHDQLHFPFRKALAVRAFAEFWRDRPWYRPNESFQIVAGIRAWHDTLLGTAHNRRGSQTVVGVYRDILGLAAQQEQPDGDAPQAAGPKRQRRSNGVRTRHPRKHA